MKEFKVGQSVYSSADGSGEVTEIVEGEDYPVIVLFKKGRANYTTKGLEYPTGIHSILFHSLQDHKEYVANIKEPIKVDLWINIYPSGDTVSHETKEIADEHATSDRLECFHFCKEYEVEE